MTDFYGSMSDPPGFEVFPGTGARDPVWAGEAPPFGAGA